MVLKNLPPLAGLTFNCNAYTPLTRGATFCRRYAAVFGCASRDILEVSGKNSSKILCETVELLGPLTRFDRVEQSLFVLRYFLPQDPLEQAQSKRATWARTHVSLKTIDNAPAGAAAVLRRNQIRKGWTARALLLATFHRTFRSTLMTQKQAQTTHGKRIF